MKNKKHEKDTVSAVSFLIMRDTVSQLGEFDMTKDVTKNIMNDDEVIFNLNWKQIIWGIIGVAVGVATFFLLKDYIIFDGLMWLIFFELIIVIGFGIVQINGMSLFTIMAKSIKGVDKRPYSNTKGVFDEDEFSIF